MTQYEFFLSFSDILFGNPFFLTGIFSIGFILKLFILTKLIYYYYVGTATSTKKNIVFLILIFCCSLVHDFSWIMISIREMLMIEKGYGFLKLWVMFAWGVYVLQCQILSLFMENLVEVRHTLDLRQKCTLALTMIYMICFLGLGMVMFFDPQSHVLHQQQLLLQFLVILHEIFFLMLPSLIKVAFKVKAQTLPRILIKQLKILILGFIVPYWVFDLLQVIPFSFSPNWITNSFTLLGVSTILFHYALIYCMRRVMRLRFLNLSEHVEDLKQQRFETVIDESLLRFNTVYSTGELCYMMQTFFTDVFKVPVTRCMLYLRHQYNSDVREESEHTHTVRNIVETHLLQHAPVLQTMLQKNRILVYDDLVFSDFYHHTSEYQVVLNFLESVDAEVFVPLYEGELLLGYIIVQRNARTNMLYSRSECAQMRVFARFVSNMIHQLYTRRYESMLKTEKELKDEVYAKHQEINQYKEGIRSFLRDQERPIGIIFYKNSRFTFGNQTAKDMINIDINQYEGHELSRAMRKIAEHVSDYRAAQSCWTKNAVGRKVVLSGIPHLEQDCVIILVYYPEINDIIKQQVDLLKNPTDWDFLLYLETTDSGRLINKLIPSSSEKFLNFKVSLLKAALSRKAVLLDMPNEDLQATVDILHCIGLREKLYIMELHESSQGGQVGAELFGLNLLYGNKTENKPLLERLNNVGTLFIKNINYLDLEVQRYLVEFIKYGIYRTFRGDRKHVSNVRIICSANQDLNILISENKFLEELLQELNQTKLIIPSVVTLEQEELNDLADGFAEQMTSEKTFKNLLSLNQKDRCRLVEDRPESLQDLKYKVEQYITAKSKQNHIEYDVEFNPAYHISDPELAQAARLGKQALKDRHVMTLLWNKFKNQNKIAQFLGVNRSSVHKRCKEYGLSEEV